jgi:cell division cycle 2-like protein
MELILRKPLFSGQKELDHVDHIFRVLGTPTDEVWPGWKNLPMATQIAFPKYPGIKLNDIIPKECRITEAGIDLIKQMLTLDPNKRITASRALKHEWFREQPMA